MSVDGLFLRRVGVVFYTILPEDEQKLVAAIWLKLRLSSY